MSRTLILGLLILAVLGAAAPKGESPPTSSDLPELDGNSTKGLKIKCSLVKKQFTVGEPVNIWCTVVNTTDGIKPIGWHSNVGLHFCCVREGRYRGGVLPRAFPQIDSPILIKSKDMQQGYVLFLPPGKSIQICLSYTPDRPESFKGRVVYDPCEPRGFWGALKKEDPPPWVDELVFSNPIEYDVISGEKE